MTPSELARETLKQLALKRTPPTPDNYRAFYHEISGDNATAIADIFPEKELKSIVTSLPQNTHEQMTFARRLDSAIGNKNWGGIKSTLADLMQKAAEPPNWSALIRELLMRLEARQADMTPARKREALDRVLASSTAPDLLHTRLQGLLKGWSQATVLEHHPAERVETTDTKESDTLIKGEGATHDLLELLAYLLESSIGVLLIDNTELAKEATALVAAARHTDTQRIEGIAPFVARMKRFSYRLNFAAEDQVEMKAALLHLLHLVIDNINELVLDDQYLQGQIAIVLDLVSQPLSLRRLDDVERHMKDVIYKQSALKKNLSEAKNQIKLMLATFVDRLADFSESTSEYHDKISRCAIKISQSTDITNLGGVLEEVMYETRAIQLSAQRSRDELNQMRTKVSDVEQEVQRLQDELTHTSQMVRHDALTGALNRKGMNEALDIEVARVRRQNGKLCVALLDIDNFKKLNDTMGHSVGDAALVHLTKVVQEAIRPEDTLARYGGEEFVVILPDTPLESATTAMMRVQRELTRCFFMNHNDKVLITFSCGVAELIENELIGDAIKRADDAMYLAKRAGKNRVLAA